MDWKAWQATGHHVLAAGHQVWHRVDGDKDTSSPWTTFFHGFPTNSYDWHKVLPLLPAGRTRLLMDHLGFGASHAPVRHRYTFDEQIDIAKALWYRYGVEETTLVAHDYSVSMVQEMLARYNRRQWDGPRISGIVFLNGGLFYSRQQRLPVQALLRSPLGPLAVRAMGPATLQRSLDKILHPSRRMGPEEVADHWTSMEAARHAIPSVSRYHDERRRNEQRWLGALQHCDRPMRFLWGLADPISGAPMIERLRSQATTPRIVTWDDVGHYPQLEAPDRVATHIAEMEARRYPFK